MVKKGHVRLALSALLAASLFLVLYRHSSTLSSLYELVSLPSLRPKTITRDPTHGSWVPSPERAVEAEGQYASCNADFSPAAGGPDGRDQEKEHQERARKVSAWEWVLDDGKPIIGWDAEAFIERALQSRGGVLIIGDSVTNEMNIGLQHLLGAHLGDWPRRVVPSVIVGEDGIYVLSISLTLQPENELYARLLAKPSLSSVPRSRFSLPIVTSYQSDVLITQEELDKIMSEIGMKEPVNRSNRRAKGDWRQGILNASTLIPWAGERETIIIVNTGPHWSPLHMTPATDDELLKGYEAMLNKVHAFFTSSPLPSLTFFRSTSPAHQNCNTFTHPVAANSSAAVDPAPTRHVFGWHLFSEYNRIARSLFAQHGSEKTRYLDIWPMSAQRPDAHTGWHVNQFDCLHWCQPSVTEWWLRTIWHIISEQGL